MSSDLLPTDYLADHQWAAIKKLSNGKILKGGVGTGKSRVACAYYKLNEAPKDVYVITTARKRDELDWVDEFLAIAIYPKGPRSGGAGPVLQQDKHGATRDATVGSDASGARDRTAAGSSGDHPTTAAEGAGEDLPVGDGSLDGGRSASTRLRRKAAGPDRSVDGGVRDSAGLSLRSEKYEVGRSESDGPAGRVAHQKVQSNVSVSRKTGESRIHRGLDDGVGGETNSLREVLPGTDGPYPFVLTVDSWNNIAKYADVRGAFFIFDEQRLVGSGSWSRKFLKIAKHNNWILLTATPGDTWMDYVPVFVANNFYKNRSAFNREHVVYSYFGNYPKIERYIGQGRLLRNKAKILVEMPYQKNTVPNHVEVQLPYDKELLNAVLKERWHVYEERPLKDVGEMFMVARRVVNGDPSRLEMVEELWKKHPRLIVFYNFNYELYSLRSLAPLSESLPSTSASKLVVQTAAGRGRATISNKIDLRQAASAMPVGTVAEWNGHKHEPVPKTDRWLYLVQYTAGNEAWNCITTNAMVMYSQNYSWKVMQQVYGRIDRLNTPFKDLWYYGFTSDSWIDKAIKRALDAKEDFNERKYSSIFT